MGVSGLEFQEARLEMQRGKPALAGTLAAGLVEGLEALRECLAMGFLGKSKQGVWAEALVTGL